MIVGRETGVTELSRCTGSLSVPCHGTTVNSNQRRGVLAVAGRVNLRTVARLLPGAVLAALAAGTVLADSSTPRLAAYYERHLAICGGDAYEWSGDELPRAAMRQVIQVGVGRHSSYALARDGQLYAWGDDFRKAEVLLEGVKAFAAGDSGVLAIKIDDTLWNVERHGGGLAGRSRIERNRIAARVRSAAAGDGTNYYVTLEGDLYAKGNAHRGQYGDGRLAGTDGFVRVAAGIREIRSHTGHAIVLTDLGEVQGTGGNIYGPVGKHGLGDKSVRWSTILDNATGVATGASHSVAIRADNTLWIWGRNEGVEPRRVLAGVAGVAAGSDSTVALAADGSLWRWRTGRQPEKTLDCPR